MIPGISTIDEMKMRKIPFDIREEQAMLERRNHNMKERILDQLQEITLLNTSLNNLENRINLLQTQLRDWETKIEFAEREKNDVEVRLEKRVEHFKTELNTKESVQDPKMVKETVEKTVMHKDEEIESLKKQIEHAEIEYKMIKDQEDNITTTFETKIREEDTSLNHEIEEKKKLTQQLRSLERDIHTLSDKESRNQKELNHIKKQNEELNNQAQRFVSKNQKLEQIVRRLESRV